MQLPVQIVFDGIDPSPAVSDAVEREALALQHFHERIISCRVTVKRPTKGHHRQGGAFEVNILVRLPTHHEIAISRTVSDEPRQELIDAAVHDAFDRVRRRIQDAVRMMRDDTKTHEPTFRKGRIAHLDREAGSGFIETSEGMQVYFHRNSVSKGTFDQLIPGDSVRFAEEAGDKGPQASTVHVERRHRR